MNCLGVIRQSIIYQHIELHPHKALGFDPTPHKTTAAHKANIKCTYKQHIKRTNTTDDAQWCCPTRSYFILSTAAGIWHCAPFWASPPPLPSPAPSHHTTRRAMGHPWGGAPYTRCICAAVDVLGPVPGVVGVGTGPISPNRGVRRGPQRGCDTSLKNSKSAIKLLQVVLASAPTAKPRVFASKHAQRRHPPQ
jgi:hypothetical protein